MAAGSTPYRDRTDEPAPAVQDAPDTAPDAEADAVAEVHAVEPIWLLVARRPRPARRPCTSRSLVRWRVELVHRPAVIRIARYGEEYDPFWYEKDGERRSVDGSDECRHHLEQVVQRFTSIPVRARLRGGPRDGQEVELGPGEPPEQLLVADPAERANGVRYRRRAWDDERAFYDHAPS